MRRFLLVAFALAWLFSLPVWLSGSGVRWSWTAVCGVAMMATPSLGVLTVVLTDRPRSAWRDVARSTGITLGPSPRKTVALAALAWFGVPAFVAVAVAMSAALGLLRLDLRNFSYYAEMIDKTTGGTKLPLSVPALVALTVVQAVTTGPAINTVFALGEEWGWRGWMLPRLVGSYGPTAGLLGSGVIWGLWHFPLTLQGYNYPELGAWAAPFFIGFCTLFAVPVGWLRLSSGSVWPAAIAHASLNASAGAVMLVADVSTPPQPHLVGITGLVGWALLAIVAVALLRRPSLFAPPPSPSTAAEPLSGSGSMGT